MNKKYRKMLEIYQIYTQADQYHEKLPTIPGVVLHELCMERPSPSLDNVPWPIAPLTRKLGVMNFIGKSTF